MPLAYIPKSLLNTSQSQPITSIHICAEPPNAVFAPKDNADPATEKLTNHWVVYLITSPSQSIRLDPSPSGPGNTLDLIISAKDRADINAVKTVILSTAPNLNVGNIIDQITSANYGTYTFGDTGQGCRFWISSLLDLLCKAGYTIDSSEATAAREALGVVWNELGEPVSASQQTGTAEGAF